ncbi:MAG: hypothetical protein AMK69_12910 [Nitrospira bacterium SG8_3]|nr:MAG: hypothetical protein AMK69_12910 [Nitrospira bacterium SG8_3]
MSFYYLFQKGKHLSQTRSIKITLIAVSQNPGNCGPRMRATHGYFLGKSKTVWFQQLTSMLNIETRTLCV